MKHEANWGLYAGCKGCIDLELYPGTSDLCVPSLCAVKQIGRATARGAMGEILKDGLLKMLQYFHNPELVGSLLLVYVIVSLPTGIDSCLAAFVDRMPADYYCCSSTIKCYHTVVSLMIASLHYVVYV